MKINMITALIMVCLPLSLFAVTITSTTPGAMNKNIYIDAVLADNVSKSIISEKGETSRFRVEH